MAFVLVPLVRHGYLFVTSDLGNCRLRTATRVTRLCGKRGKPGKLHDLRLSKNGMIVTEDNHQERTDVQGSKRIRHV